MKTTNPFKDYLRAVDEARVWGQHAGWHNDPVSVNPYPAGCYLSDLWLRHRSLTRAKCEAALNNALAERHEQQFAEQFSREGEVCRGGEGFLARLYRRFAGLIQGEPHK